MVLIDVTDDASVAAAAKTIEADGGLDVLVNNAGIEMRIEGNVVPGAAEITADLMRSLFETNVFGVVRVTHAFLPLLRRSAAPVVVNVSSGLASIARVTAPGTPSYDYPGVAYPASKAAVNMITVQFAKAFPDMRINAVEPGYTATDLNGHAGTQTVEKGAEIIVRMAQVGPDGPTGGYFGAEGPRPWKLALRPSCRLGDAAGTAQPGAPGWYPPRTRRWLSAPEWLAVRSGGEDLCGQFCVLAAAEVRHLAVAQAPVVVHGHRCLAAGCDRPDGPVDEQVHVVFTGGEAVRRECTDLDAGGQVAEEAGHAVLAGRGPCHGAVLLAASAAQSTSSLTRSRIAATSPRPTAS